MSRSISKFPPRRGVAVYKLLIALAIFFSLPVMGYYAWSMFARAKSGVGPMMYRVERGEFVHEITDRGNVESADNVEIRCEVKAKGAAGTTILEIVPEGTMVKPGDVLVRLDSSALENEDTAQSIAFNNSKAALIQAQKVLDTAIIAKEEYIEGVYLQEEKTIQNDIFVAQENLSRAVEYLKYSERLAAKGYITDQQLEADRFAVEQARKAKEIADTRLIVLSRFTKKKMIVQLESDIKTAEANVNAKKAAYDLDMEQLDLIKSQIEKCVIRSPEAGQVVYANITGWRGNKEVIIEPGEQVRERQVLIRLPDPSRMQVVAKINESKVTLVKAGMPATIRLDAFPDVELRGTVEKVDEFPVPTSFFGSSVKEYETIVRIDDESPPGLRPGLTAEVRIRVEHASDALMVPVQAVFEQGGNYYCVARKSDNYYAKKIAFAASNDKMVVVEDGLSESEEVVLNARAFRDKVDLPEPDAGPPAEARPDSAAEREEPRDRTAGAERMFKQLDGDGDGKLQFDELPEGLREAMKAADADGDGAIDKSEWLAAAEQLRPARGAPGKKRYEQ
ncbi:MAG: HlyD family efflux transporter periplasmic adaptor subunit [Pirellulales bacterium]|nr:HlyD family efflux transporter periplasmic adaptor subunit [Pirellulales bacterium]